MVDFDVANSTANFDDGNLGFVIIIIAVETALNFIGDVGDDLYRTSAKVSTALFLQNGPVTYR